MPTTEAHEKREEIRDQIVSRMRDMRVRTISANSYAELQKELGLDVEGVSRSAFVQAITGSHYKRDGRLHISRGSGGISTPRSYSLTCLVA